MKKYAKVINEETKLCEVGLGTNSAFYQSIGMTEMEVEQAYDGSYYLKGYAPIQNLDELKASKLSELTAITSKFDNQLVNTDMIIKSSLGFSINADLRSQLNIRRLINIGTEPVSFVIADNTTVDLSLAQLNILISECEANMQYLFELKQSYKKQIADATTKEELDAIDLQFTMKDFSIK